MGSKLTCFLCEGSQLIVFSLDVEVDFFMPRVENDFVAVLGPIIRWFSCMDRN